MNKTLKEIIPNEYDNIRLPIGGDWSIWIEKNFDYEFGEKVNEWYLCELFYKDEFLSSLDCFVASDEDTEETIIARCRDMLKDTYIGIEDYQGGDFKVGDFMSIKEWKAWALQDRDNCCDDYLYKIIKRTPLKGIIESICVLWGIEIIKVVLD